jgi:hypothetical protein
VAFCPKARALKLGPMMNATGNAFAFKTDLSFRFRFQKRVHVKCEHINKEAISLSLSLSLLYNFAVPFNLINLFSFYKKERTSTNGKHPSLDYYFGT